MNASLIRTELIYNFAPRYVRRWFITSLLLLVPFFATWHRAVVGFDESASHPTGWSWVVALLWAALTVRMIVLVAWHRHHLRRSVEESYAHQLADAVRQVEQTGLSRRVGPYDVRPLPTPPEDAVVAPAAAQSPLTVVRMAKARSTEEHEGFVVVDRRRFAHLADE